MQKTSRQTRSKYPEGLDTADREMRVRREGSSNDLKVIHRIPLKELAG